MRRGTTLAPDEFDHEAADGPVSVSDWLESAIFEEMLAEAEDRGLGEEAARDMAIAELFFDVGAMAGREACRRPSRKSSD